MTECLSGCGACCDPVTLPYNKLEAMTDPRLMPGDRKWATEYLTAMPYKEAMAKAPWLRGRMLAEADGTPVQPFYFRCSALDRETRRCAIYEDRPLTCRGYPWYGGEARPDATLPPACSFNADVGRVPVALTVKPRP